MNRYTLREIVEGFAEAVSIGNTSAAEAWARLAFARRDEATTGVDPYHYTGWGDPDRCPHGARWTTCLQEHPGSVNP